MDNTEHFRKLERMYAAAPTNKLYQPRLTIGSGQARLSLDVAPQYFHAAGAVHGSVYFKALDDAAYFAVNSVIEDVLVLTASFNVHFLRPVVDGTITAHGKVVHRSRRRLIAEATLHEAGGLRIAWGEGTFMRSEIELSPTIGYV